MDVMCVHGSCCSLNCVDTVASEQGCPLVPLVPWLAGRLCQERSCGTTSCTVKDHTSLCVRLCVQIRDHLTTFFTNLNSSAPAFLEKYGGASENSDLDALPEEVQAMLGDKDTLLNAIQVGADGFRQGEGAMTLQRAGPGARSAGGRLAGAQVGLCLQQGTGGITTLLLTGGQALGNPVR